MAENEIIILQDRLYEYLKGLHEADPHFMFWLRESPQSLKTGYWFTEKVDSKENTPYIVTNFIEGFDEPYPYESRICYDTTTHQWNFTLKRKHLKESQNELLASLGFVRVSSWSWIWNKVVLATDDFLKPLDFFYITGLKK